MVLMVKNLPANEGDIREASQIHGWEKSPGGRHVTHSSILAGEPHGQRAWQAMVLKVTKSQT